MEKRGEDFLGLRYSRDQSSFRVWAPGQQDLTLKLYSSSRSTSALTFPMKKEGDFFRLDLPGDRAGSFYTYQLGEREVTDPYSISASMNSTRSAILDLRATDPPAFRESTYVPIPPQEAIIYELHVGDFTFQPQSGVRQRGHYLGLAEEGTRYQGPGFSAVGGLSAASPSQGLDARAGSSPAVGFPGRDGRGFAGTSMAGAGPSITTGLDHLKELGITHVHLMPVFDFLTVDERKDRFGAEDNYNWGYDPELFMVPEGSYASKPYQPANRIYELKTLVAALHQAGIGVIMDVVFNHTYKTENSNLNILAPGYYYRSQGSAFSNGSGVGNELASERPMVRRLILDALSYWQREYKIDGFRFDLMALMDLETVQLAVQTLRAVNPYALIYGEPWGGGKTALPFKQQTLWPRQARSHFALFNEDFRKGMKGDNDGPERGYIQGNLHKRGAVERGLAGSVSFERPLNPADEAIRALKGGYVVDPTETINYFDAHDNLILEDKLQISAGSQDRIDDMTRLAFALLLTAQGIPFFHAGSEFRRSKGGNPNAYDAPWSLNAIDWGKKAENQDLCRYVEDLIAFRKQEPCLRLGQGGEVRQRMQVFSVDNDNVIASLIQREAEDPNHFLLFLYSDAWLPARISLQPLFQALSAYHLYMQKIFDRRGPAKINRVLVSRSDRNQIYLDPISMTVFAVTRLADLI